MRSMSSIFYIYFYFSTCYTSCIFSRLLTVCWLPGLLSSSFPSWCFSLMYFLSSVIFLNTFLHKFVSWFASLWISVSVLGTLSQQHRIELEKNVIRLSCHADCRFMTFDGPCNCSELYKFASGLILFHLMSIIQHTFANISHFCWPRFLLLI